MSTSSDGSPPRHLTERERAIKATVLGVGLGLFLHLAAALAERPRERGSERQSRK